MAGVAQYVPKNQTVLTNRDSSIYGQPTSWTDHIFCKHGFSHPISVFPFGSDPFGRGRLCSFFSYYKIEYLIQKNLRKKEIDRVGETAQWIRALAVQAWGPMFKPPEPT